MTTAQLLKRFYKYEFMASLVCILMPFILMLVNNQVLGSISKYAYTEYAFIYMFLLTSAATLITVVGVKKDRVFTWVLGLLLMVVSLTPHLMFPITHMVASVLFFGGIIINILYYTQEFYKFRLFLILAIVLSFGLHFLTNIVSLFVVESIALIVYGVNFLSDIIGERKAL